MEPDINIKDLTHKLAYSIVLIVVIIIIVTATQRQNTNTFSKLVCGLYSLLFFWIDRFNFVYIHTCIYTQRPYKHTHIHTHHFRARYHILFIIISLVSLRICKVQYQYEGEFCVLLGFRGERQPGSLLPSILKLYLRVEWLRTLMTCCVSLTCSMDRQIQASIQGLPFIIKNT